MLRGCSQGGWEILKGVHAKMRQYGACPAGGTPAPTSLRRRLSRLVFNSAPAPVPFPSAPRSTCPTRCARCSSTRRWASPRPPSATCRSSWRPIRASCPSGEEQGEGTDAQHGELRVERLEEHEATSRGAGNTARERGTVPVHVQEAPQHKLPRTFAYSVHRTCTHRLFSPLRFGWAWTQRCDYLTTIRDANI